MSADTRRRGLVKKLAEYFGEGSISDNPQDLRVYAHDASTEAGAPSCIVWPRSEREVQDLVRLALRYKETLVPRGAGTGLVGGSVPNGAIAVDMSLMNRITSVDVQQKTATVEAGVVISDLNDALDDYDLWYPLMPASYEVCHIGGTVATNAAGMRAIKYGETSDWVISVRMVDGTGKPVTVSPGEVCGTEGVLGLIVSVTVRLTDVNTQRSLTVQRFTDIDDFSERVQQAVREKHVSSVECFDKHAARLKGLKPEYYLFIEYDSADQGNISNAEKIERLFRLRRSMGPLLSSKGYLIMEDPQVPISELSRFLRWLNNNQVPVFGHAGDGILHPRFKTTQHKLINDMYKKVQELNGCVSGEHGIGISKKRFVTEGYKQRIQKLKEIYDPEGIFNRGKIYE